MWDKKEGRGGEYNFSTLSDNSTLVQIKRKWCKKHELIESSYILNGTFSPKSYNVL